MKTVKQAQITGKKVILRVDYNVTLNANGEIIDDIKIKSTLNTIKYILSKKPSRIILISHFGRPVIRPNWSIDRTIEGNKNLEMLPIARSLSKNINCDPKKIKKVDLGFQLPMYQINETIYLCENIRFTQEEEKNDPKFAKEIAKLGDVYVDDAFGNAHRKHASMVGVTKYLPSFAGLLMSEEVTKLGKLLEKPPKPFVLILGGAKTSEKIQTLRKLMKKASKILLGGVTANTFLVGRQVNLKRSSYDKDCIDLANDLYTSAAKKFYLPVDLVWRNEVAVDIGKTTVAQYIKIIEGAETIFWNGTMGLTSMGNYKYAIGTHDIIRAIASSRAKTKIICGGDTIAEVEKLGLSKKMTYISTGGGAALEFLAGKKLPAIEALDKNN